MYIINVFNFIYFLRAVSSSQTLLLFLGIATNYIRKSSGVYYVTSTNFIYFPTVVHIFGLIKEILTV